MSNYPSSIFSPRVLVDRVGAVYDASKTKVFFAKDHNDPLAEIVAIENELGLNAKGAFDSVAEWLQSLSDAIDAIVTNYVQAVVNGPSYSTTSSSWIAANSTYAKVTIVTTGRPVRISMTFPACHRGDASDRWGFWDIAVDASDGSGRIGNSNYGLVAMTGKSDRGFGSLHMEKVVTGLAAGSHTFYLMYRRLDIGTTYIGSGVSQLVMIAEEL